MIRLFQIHVYSLIRLSHHQRNKGERVYYRADCLGPPRHESAAATVSQRTGGYRLVLVFVLVLPVARVLVLIPFAWQEQQGARGHRTGRRLRHYCRRPPQYRRLVRRFDCARGSIRDRPSADSRLNRVIHCRLTTPAPAGDDDDGDDDGGDSGDDEGDAGPPLDDSLTPDINQHTINGNQYLGRVEVQQLKPIVALHYIWAERGRIAGLLLMEASSIMKSAP